MEIAPISFPKTFAILTPDEVTDYSHTRKVYAYRTRISYRINGEIEVRGRKLLTGWHRSASMNVTFFVSYPLSEEAWKEAVLAALHELSSTQEVMVLGDRFYLLGLIHGIPIGCFHEKVESVSNIRKPRVCETVSEFISRVKEGWKVRVSAAQRQVEDFNEREGIDV